MADTTNKTKGLVIAAALLIVLAVVVLMGGAVIGGFSKILRTDTTNLATAIILPANGSSTAVGTTGQYPFLQSVTDPCVNTTNSSITYDIGNYTVNEGTADGGNIALAADSGDDANEGRTVNCTISYLADTEAQSSADDFSDGLAIFGLFVGIIALAIIGKVVIGFFQDEG